MNSNQKNQIHISTKTKSNQEIFGEEDYKSFGFISLLELLVPCFNGVARDHLSLFRCHLLSFSSLLFSSVSSPLLRFFNYLACAITILPSIVFLFLLYLTRDFVSHNYTHQICYFPSLSKSYIYIYSHFTPQIFIF